MKIKNINISGGTVNFYDNLKIIKNENAEKTELIEILLKLKCEQLEQLEAIKNQIGNSPKTNLLSKLDNFITQHILPIGYSMSGSALFEILTKM